MSSSCATTRPPAATRSDGGSHPEEGRAGGAGTTAGRPWPRVRVLVVPVLPTASSSSARGGPEDKEDTRGAADPNVSRSRAASLAAASLLAASLLAASLLAAAASLAPPRADSLAAPLAAAPLAALAS